MYLNWSWTTRLVLFIWSNGTKGRAYQRKTKQTLGVATCWAPGKQKSLRTKPYIQECGSNTAEVQSQRIWPAELAIVFKPPTTFALTAKAAGATIIIEAVPVSYSEGKKEFFERKASWIREQNKQNYTVKREEKWTRFPEVRALANSVQFSSGQPGTDMRLEIMHW